MSKVTLPRRYREVIEEAGLEILDWRQKKHYVVRVRNAQGVETSLALSVSESDQRSLENHRRDAKRAARKTPTSPKED